MYRSSTIVDKFLAVLSGLCVLVFVASTDAAECETSKGLTYNFIFALAPSSDTLWMATWDKSSNIALNVIEGNGSLKTKLQNDGNWLSYNLGCRQEYNISDLAYGDGMALALFDTLKAAQANPVIVFRVQSNSIKLEKEFHLEWNDSLLSDSSRCFTAKDAVWADGKFYFACFDGGLVRWDYNQSATDLFFPGKSTSQLVRDFSISSKIIPDTTKRVTGIEKAAGKLVVTTPAKCWFFSPKDSSWDSSIESSMIDSDLKFQSFDHVFATDSSLFGIICTRTSSQTDTTIFAQYISSKKGWACVLDKNPQAVSFGPQGYVYMVSDSNVIEAYKFPSTGNVERNPAPVTTFGTFKKRMTPASYGIEFPDYINDIQFVPVNDSTGYLWVASSDGLFFSDKEIPGKSTDSLILLKRAPNVKLGLKQTYARPGILTQGYFDSEQSRTVFIYNLSKDATVTIRIYDYNMDLVKTVINAKPRKAGNNGGPQGRSTVESEDWWDGRLNSGKMAAPGVYYYKITTNIGERAFGKIVVAK